MKNILLLLTVLVVQNADANTKNLVCTSGRQYEKFEATLDYSGFSPKSTYFEVTYASIIDNFVSGNLICAGHALDDVQCTGFAFNIPDHIIVVDLQATDGKFFASYETLRGELPAQHNGPWPCELK